jgi:hypothetical protein
MLLQTKKELRGVVQYQRWSHVEIDEKDWVPEDRFVLTVDPKWSWREWTSFDLNSKKEETQTLLNVVTGLAISLVLEDVVQ